MEVFTRYRVKTPYTDLKNQLNDFINQYENFLLLFTRICVIAMTHMHTDVKITL